MARKGSYGEWIKQQEQKKKAREMELAYSDKILDKLEEEQKMMESIRKEADDINESLKGTISLEKKLTKETYSGKGLKEKIAKISLSSLDTSKKLLTSNKMTTKEFASMENAIDLVHGGMMDLDKLTSLRIGLIKDGNEELSDGGELLLGYLNSQEQILLTQAKSEKLLGAIDDITGGTASKAKEIYEQFGAGYGKLALWGVALTTAVALLTSFSSRLDNVGDTFGTLGVTEFSNQLMSADAEMQRLGYDAGSAGEAAMELSNSFGVAFGEAVKLAPTTAEMARSMGMSVTEASTLLGVLTEIGGLTPQQAEDLTKSAEQLAVAEGVAPSQVMKEVSASTETFAKFGKDGGKNILGAAIQAKKLGTNLDTIAGISDGLLDFQNSLNAEMEASIMIGRQLNFQKARELALNNDIEGAMSAVIDQLGSEEEFNKLNALQRKSLADSIGVSTAELAKFVGKESEAASLADRIGAQKGFEELAGEDAISTLSSITFELKSLAAELTKTFGPVLNMALKAISAILQPIGSVIRFFTEWGTAAKVTAGIIGFMLLPQIMAQITAAKLWLGVQKEKIKQMIIGTSYTKAETFAEQLRSKGVVFGTTVTQALTAAKNKGILASIKSAAVSTVETVKSFALASAQIVQGIASFFAGAASGSAATLGFGTPAFVAMAVAGVAALMGALAMAPRFANLPSGKSANIEKGIAIGDAGESITKTEDLKNMGGESTAVVNAVRELKAEMSSLRSDMNTYLGLGGSAIRGIGTEVVSAIDRAGS